MKVFFHKLNTAFYMASSIFGASARVVFHCLDIARIMHERRD